jgi:hypothetical protein
MDETTLEMLAADLRLRLDGTLYARTPRPLRDWRLARFDRKLASADGQFVLRTFFLSAPPTAATSEPSMARSRAQAARA